MTSSKADWSLMRGPLLMFTVCVLASVALVTGSHRFRQDMERGYQTNHSRFRTASEQYLAVDEEERIIDEFYPAFVRLHRDGLLGNERRLSWLEALRAAGDAIHIPQLTYKIEAQRQAVAEFPLQLGTYRLDVSPMTLNAGLLHEGDLLQILSALDRDAYGQYSVRECTLQRASDELTLDPATPNITADCTLEWQTLNLSSGKALGL